MFKKIFTIVLFIAAMLVLANSSKAQTMYFCESVDGSGYPVGESSVFNISSSGGYLDVLVRLPYDLNCNSVKFDVYYRGAYDNTIYMDTQNNWQWFYKQITFYNSGSYTIYCYDCNSALLASGSLTIQFR